MLTLIFVILHSPENVVIKMLVLNLYRKYTLFLQII